MKELSCYLSEADNKVLESQVTVLKTEVLCKIAELKSEGEESEGDPSTDDRNLGSRLDSAVEKLAEMEENFHQMMKEDADAFKVSVCAAEKTPQSLS